VGRVSHSALQRCCLRYATGAILPAGRSAYHLITSSQADKTVVLTGHDLTVEQVVEVARFGAKVELSPEARQRSADAYGLLLEAAPEGVPVYWFNRGSGAGRQTVIFAGDALAPENKGMLEKWQLGMFRRGARAGMGRRSATRKSCVPCWSCALTRCNSRRPVHP
jgi:histidine ammonia-lyase